MRQKRVKDGPLPLSRSSAKITGLQRTSSFASAGANDLSDDEGSLVDVSAEPSGNGRTPRTSCGACKTKDSTYWWKAPRGFDLTSSILCDSCGLLWRKYAEIKPARGEEAFKNKGQTGEKRDGTPLTQGPAKRTKVSTIVA